MKSKGSLGSPYAVRDYYAIDANYGGPAGFRRLVDAAHRDGFKVTINIVANHTAWDSVLMQRGTLSRPNRIGPAWPP